jgi:hypothetical protein
MTITTTECAPRRARSAAPTISPARAIRRLVELCPSLAEDWAALVLDPANRGRDAALLSDETAESVVRHLAVMYLAGHAEVLEAVRRFRLGLRAPGCTPHAALVEWVQAYLTVPDLIALPA